MSEQNKAVAVRFITAMGSNDPETARNCFAPDGVAIAMGTTNFASRPRTPQDIAEGASFLASDRASWVTGSHYVLDGGLTASLV